MGWLAGYSYRKQITISNAQVTADLSNFPLLVVLSGDTDVGAHALSNGYDIRFTSSDGTTALGYQREAFAVSGGAATGNFWVQVPTITTATSTTIYMYYGNAGASDGSSATAPWDANFNAVYHLEESGNGTAGEYKDATGNANGTGGGGTLANVPSQTTGISDKGQSFNGTSDYIALGTGAKVNPANNFTMETWYKGSTKTNDQLILSWGVNTTGQRRSIWLALTTGYVNFSGYDANITTTTAVCDGSWHHLAVTVTSANLVTVYKDGASIASGTPTLSAFTTAGSLIGWSGNATEYSQGIQDEVRISGSVRSAAWIQFTYHNIADPGNELTIGSETAAPNPAPPIAPRYLLLMGSVPFIEAPQSVSTTWTRSLSDSLAGNDLGVNHIAAYMRLQSDNIGVNDVYSRTANRSRNIIDSLGVNDQAVRRVNSSRSLQDNIGYFDLLLKQVNSIRLLQDSISLSDQLSRQVSSIRLLQDSIGLNEQLLRQASNVRLLQDVLASFDQTSRTSNNLRQLIDTLALSDSVSRTASLFRLLSDNLGINDSLIAELIGLHQHALRVEDNLGLHDSSPLRQVRSFRTLLDNLGSSDEVERITTALRNISDSLGISDNVLSSILHLLLLRDNLGITDILQNVSSYLRLLVDIVGGFDQSQRNVSSQRFLSDNLAFNDPVKNAAQYLRIISDNLGISDSLIAKLILYILVVRVIKLTGSLSNRKLTGSLSNRKLTGSKSSRDLQGD